MGQRRRISLGGDGWVYRRFLLVVSCLAVLTTELRADEESDFEFEDRLELKKDDGKLEKLSNGNSTRRKELDFLSDEAGSGTDEVEEEEEYGSGWISHSQAPITRSPPEGPTIFVPTVPQEPVSEREEYFRITINFTSMRYVAVLSDRNSPQFQGLAVRVKRSVEDLFVSIPGDQTATVVQFRPGTLDPAAQPSIIATLDFSTKGFYNSLTLFNVINGALHRGTIGSLTASPQGFSFRPFHGGSLCPKQIGRQPTSLPRLGETKTNLMLDNRFICDGLLTRISYFRGSPHGHFYVGIWRQDTEHVFHLKHRIEVPPAAIGIHDIHLRESLPVERGDFLGIHYPRAANDGIIVYSIPADNVLPTSEMFQTLVINAHDEDFPTVSTIDIQRFDQFMESRTFALIGFLVNDTDASCKDWQFHCSNGWCIEKTRVCNGIDDCNDNSDEKGCDIPTQAPTPRHRDCLSSEFSCGDGLCISSDSICDDRYDCPDGRDEADCVQQPECDPVTEFTCGDGQCVDISGRCDRTKYDCTDGTDEQDCVVATPKPGCHHREFTCGDGTCIPSDAVCDRRHDCPDRSDEENCVKGVCDRATEFTCGDGTCVDISGRCDRTKYDCVDGTDEYDCESHTPTPGITGCRSSEFSCGDGSCIDNLLLCDDHSDCPDGSDEANCDRPDRCNPVTEFTCGDGKCVDISGRCDRTKYDCADGTDEFDCDRDIPTPRPGCHHHEFTCGDGTCIPSDAVCNQRRDCRDGTDEENCRVCDPAREFTCGDGTCVDISGRCDRTKYDCTDGTDEYDCDKDIPRDECDLSYQFSCDGRRCIDMNSKCDGRNDCNDRTDEENCDPPQRTCDSLTQFTCNDGACVDITGRCDRTKYDCVDGSDENDCDERVCDTHRQFTCGDGSCIDIAYKCDGRLDCHDGSDERNCLRPTDPPPACDPVRQFTCGDGQCVDITGRCDRTKYDCADGTDEFDCEGYTIPPSRVCDSTQFRCGDGRCVDRSSVCDGRYDCADRSDEENCKSPCDPTTEFTCGDGSCVDISGRCDRTKYDCVDGTDEYDCEDHVHVTSRPRQCESTRFRCNDGGCVDRGYVCDGRNDCTDGSDEENCKSPCDPTREFTCGDGSCVDISGRCDRTKYDCVDGTDEYDCEDHVTSRPKPCESTQFRCNDGGCVGRSDVCDGRHDCRDGSDEENCKSPCDPTTEFTCGDGSCVDINGRCDRTKYDCVDGTDEYDCEDHGTPRPRQCESTQFRCNDGGCVDRGYVCDGRYDCKDASDEEDCRHMEDCGSTEFRCHDGSCIGLHVKCDGISDCRDRSDEEDCHCLTHQFRCTDGQCIDDREKCDGRRDCSDGSDEQGCASRVTVSISPQQLRIRVGMEAMFRCFVEGHAYTPTQWGRRGGDLPRHAKDEGGRLIISPVDVEDSGEYYCVAAYITGRPEASVQLTVEDIYGPTTTTRRPRPGKCDDGEAPCANGVCIPHDYFCDVDYDCTDRSDEENCSSPGPCEPNEFQCANGKCILQLWRCDGESDCDDKSDERGCLATEEPGAECGPYEFSCTRIRQCVPAGLHCDDQADCQDRSDEVGCVPPTIVKPPPSEVATELGQIITIECEAIGVPPPLIVWRLNWGHIGTPPRVTTATHKIPDYGRRGVTISKGVLTIRDAQKGDEGAYTCEAMNSKGNILAVPDAIVIIRPPDGVCRSPYFNDEAHTTADCVSCFCFGVTQDCASSHLYLSQVVSSSSMSLVDYRTRSPLPSSDDILKFNVERREFSIEDYERNIRGSGYYWSLPSVFLGNRVTSYGGKLTFTVYYEARRSGRQLETGPDLLIYGNGMSLYHSEFVRPFAGIEQTPEILLKESAWTLDEAGRRQATRSDFMMVLQNIEFILIKSNFERNQDKVRLSGVSMTTAATENTRQGRAVLVEQCRCPSGYTGTSCERCGSGYYRQRAGDYLGQCIPCECDGCDPETGVCQRCRDNAVGPRCDRCLPGYYAAARPGTVAVQCITCPCPPPNRRADVSVAECELDSDQNVNCLECPSGYSGRLCDDCASGFERKAAVCEPVGRRCDPRGSVPTTSIQCSCKRHVAGQDCGSCRENTFHLSESNPDGCLPCHCMGVTQSCTSSTLYRAQIRLSPSTEEHGLVLTNENRLQNLTGGFRVDARNQEVIYRNPQGRRIPADSFWLLPSKFLGNKLTSYGGYLQYTKRDFGETTYPDVQISGTGIVLQFRRGQHEERLESMKVLFSEQYWTHPNKSQATRDDLLIVLSNLDYILIKAANAVETRIGDLVMDSAERRNAGLGRAYSVEECVCPVGYTGLSCEQCASGYWRSNPDPRIGQCQPCDCHGHSSTCDSVTGRCINCQHNTEGNYCDTCARGFYGDATRGTSMDCLPCPCPLTHSPNQFSPTCILDADNLVTCTACPVGHAGRRCEFCVGDYSGDPQITGDYCKPNGGKQGDSECDCDTAGTIPNTHCDFEFSRCQCKTHVHGSDCSECRPGYFFLSPDNPQGCLSCYCMGLTKDCRSSNFHRSQIEPDYVGDHGFRLMTRRLGGEIEHGIVADVFQEEILYEDLPDVQIEKTSLYWHLPSKFFGNQVASYGGHLSFVIQYTLFSRESSSYADADVELISGDNRFYLFLQTPPIPDEINFYNISLVESSFRQLDGTSPTRETFLKALASLDAILIRATHYTHMSTVTLGRLAMDTAVNYATRHDLAVEVEQCSCPAGYSGLSCEQCAPGYSRVPDPSLPLGRCVRCDCNHHSSSCDLHTGACLDCRDHTTGDRCDRCEAGFFGNPTGGTSSDCLPCPCPLTSQENRFSSTCYLEEDGLPTCDQCLPGYTGRQCERCAVGYIGDPSVPGRSCVRVTEENRPRVSVSPKRHSVSTGGEANFRCSVESGEVAQVQWIRADGRSLPARAVVGNDHSLMFHRVESTDEGRYICIARNRFGNSQEEVSLTVSGERKLLVIVNQPKQQTVSLGSTVQFNCTGFSQYAYTLAWSRQNGQLLSSRVADDGQGLLTIRDIQSEDEGSYICTGSNYYNVAMDTAVIQISDEERPPTVRIEPRSLRVESGESIEFHCIASGYPVPHVRWSGGPGGRLPHEAVADGNVLRIQSVTSHHSGEYECTAYSYLGSNAATATLEVLHENIIPTFEIELSEQELEVFPGSEARIACSARGNRATVQRIEWTRDKGDLPSGSYQRGGQLVIPRCEPTDSGTYVCTIYLVDGEQQVAYSTLVVRPDGRITLRMDPESLTARPGSQAILRCLIDGAPTSAVKWSRVRESLGPNHRIDGNILTILRVSTEDRGVYVCEAVNRFGRVTASAVVELERQESPIIEIYPRAAMTLNIGGSALFQCRSTRGVPTPSITWQRADGRPFPRTVRVLEGTLEFVDVTGEEKGTYVCTAANAVGSTHASTTIEIIGSSLQVSLVPGSQTLRPGDHLRLTCSVPNSRSVRIEWFKDGGSMSSHAIIGRSTLEIVSVTAGDAGHYRCQATDDRHGQISHSSAEVTVLVPPSAVIAPRTLNAIVGQSVEFICEVTGYPEPTIQWNKEIDGLPPGHRIHGAKLLLYDIQPRHTGRYVCIVNNEVGTTRDYATLNVLTNGGNGNGNSVRDEKKLVTVGDRIEIKCEVVGDQATRVTWVRVDGSLPPTAEVHDTLLVLPQIEPSDQGIYRCLASNVLATVYAQVTIIVQGPPLVTLSRQTKAVSVGSNVTIICRAGGTPTPTVSWSKRGGRLPRGSTVFNNTLFLVSLQPEDFGDFVCTARNRFGMAEGIISLLPSGSVPYFSQDFVSYHIYPGIRDAYANIDFEISFKPETADGLILYNGQSESTGDFISFGLRDGKAEFRFDAGAGPVVITSDPLILGTWHTVRARKYGKNGLLAVDGKEFRGQILGRFTGLDLAEDLYLGGMPDFRMISKEARYDRGFKGCISRLIINGIRTAIGDDAVATVGVSNCPVCQDRPCRHGGLCQPAASRTGYQCKCNDGFSGLHCELTGTHCGRDTCGSYGQCHDLPDDRGYKCVCPLNRSGPRCEQGSSLNIPSFNRSSYIAYPMIEGALSEIQIEMTVNPKNLDDAILLYDAFDDLGDNDFIALLMVDEYVEFRYNLGSGPAVIQSAEPLRIGEWTTILAEINQKDGSLTINDGFRITGQSSGRTVGLNLKTPLYVGGVDHGSIRLALDVPIDRGFHGCISQLKIKGHEIDLVKSAIDSARVDECLDEHRQSMCLRLTPCQNGGTCQDVGSTYRCLCRTGFIGETCDIRVSTLTSAEFKSRSSYVELHPRILIHSASREEIIQMTIATTSSDGVLLWQGQVGTAAGTSASKDFIALSLESGYVVFSYELGSGQAKLISNFPIDDDEEHKIIAKRRGKRGVLIVDDDEEITGESGGKMMGLDVNGNIFIGGVPNIQAATGGRFNDQFAGCISNVLFQSRGPVDFIRNATQINNIAPCSV